MPRWSVRLALVGLLAAAGPIAAQDTLTTEKKAPDLWRTTVDLAFTGARGNEHFALFTAGGKFTRLETSRYELELDASIRYGRTTGRDIARNAKAGLKLDLDPKGRWSPFTSVTAERDALRKLDLRLQGGAGGIYTFVRQDSADVSVSAASLYDQESQVDIGTRHTARWSLRLKGTKTFASGIKLEHTSFYQPLWNSPGDYLISARTTVSTRLTKRVALTFNYAFDRDSTPPPEVDPDDQVVTVGLRLEL